MTMRAWPPPPQMALQGMCLRKAQKKAQVYQQHTDLLLGTGTRPRSHFSNMSQEEMIQQYKLQKKNYWTRETKEVFQELKQRFHKGVILQFPDLSKEWWITVDSTTYALWGTLEQEDDNRNLRPLASFSKTLPGIRTERPDGSYHKTGQLNWHISDQEM